MEKVIIENPINHIIRVGTLEVKKGLCYARHCSIALGTIDCIKDIAGNYITITDNQLYRMLNNGKWEVLETETLWIVGQEGIQISIYKNA